MRRVNTDESVRLRLHLTEDHKGVGSATVTVSVYDEEDPGVAILDEQECSEVSGFTGYYMYDWAHGLTERTKVVAKYSYGDLEFSEHLVIDHNLVTEIDDQNADGDGQAF